MFERIDKKKGAEENTRRIEGCYLLQNVKLL
jgi:hypothetical protein